MRKGYEERMRWRRGCNGGSIRSRGRGEDAKEEWPEKRKENQLKYIATCREMGEKTETKERLFEGYQDTGQKIEKGHRSGKVKTLC